jgi:hypothetical protein
MVQLPPGVSGRSTTSTWASEPLDRGPGRYRVGARITLVPVLVEADRHPGLVAGDDDERDPILRIGAEVRVQGVASVGEDLGHVGVGAGMCRQPRYVLVPRIRGRQHRALGVGVGAVEGCEQRGLGANRRPRGARVPAAHPHLMLVHGPGPEPAVAKRRRVASELLHSPVGRSLGAVSQLVTALAARARSFHRSLIAVSVTRSTRTLPGAFGFAASSLTGPASSRPPSSARSTSAPPARIAGAGSDAHPRQRRVTSQSSSRGRTYFSRPDGGSCGFAFMLSPRCPMG